MKNPQKNPFSAVTIGLTQTVELSNPLPCGQDETGLTLPLCFDMNRMYRWMRLPVCLFVPNGAMDDIDQNGFFAIVIDENPYLLSEPVEWAVEESQISQVLGFVARYHKYLKLMATAWLPVSFDEIARYIYGTSSWVEDLPAEIEAIVSKTRTVDELSQFLTYIPASNDGESIPCGDMFLTYTESSFCGETIREGYALLPVQTDSEGRFKLIAVNMKWSHMIQYMPSGFPIDDALFENLEFISSYGYELSWVASGKWPSDEFLARIKSRPGVLEQKILRHWQLEPESFVILWGSDSKLPTDIFIDVEQGHSRFGHEPCVVIPTCDYNPKLWGKSNSAYREPFISAITVEREPRILCLAREEELQVFKEDECDDLMMNTMNFVGRNYELFQKLMRSELSFNEFKRRLSLRNRLFLR